MICDMGALRGTSRKALKAWRKFVVVAAENRDSVQRYTKTWLLVRERSKMYKELLAEAKLLVDDRGIRNVCRAAEV